MVNDLISVLDDYYLHTSSVVMVAEGIGNAVRNEGVYKVIKKRAR